MSPLEQRFWSHVEQSGSCWSWTGRTNAYGYGMFGNLAAHRISWELAHHRLIPAGKVIRHTCDNPGCVNPHHLEIGTQADNMRDKVKRGRHRYGISRGEQHGRAKVTDDVVRVIRQVYPTGRFTHSELAFLAGVSRASVANYIHGRNWRHV